MRPTSALSLFLFLQITSSVPIPDSINPTSTPCAFAACREFLSGPHTPPTRLADPQFPDHHLSPPSASEEPFDNSPYTPASHDSPSDALAANKPLASSYLQSLSKAASEPTIQKAPLDQTTDALPSKPTSVLPELRKDDALRYWTSLRSSGHENADGGDVSMGDNDFLPTASRGKFHCGGLEFERLSDGRVISAKKAGAAYVVREYSDVMVVGIVLMFLIIVICVETVEKFGSLKAAFSRSPLRRHRNGEIYLHNNEKVVMDNKPINILPRPVPRYKIRLDNEKPDEGSDSEGFQYDSDADERV